jgi:hypothetical protein
MMPLFRQERCVPRAPIRCHEDFTSHERQHRLAQHDKIHIQPTYLPYVRTYLTYICMYLRRYVRRCTYLPCMYITLNIMGITQGCNKIGYDFENELKNL